MTIKRSLLATMLATAVLFTACDNNKTDTGTSTDTPSAPEAEMTAVIPYTLINEYPHDAAAFTEGLEFVNGSLYESTGEHGTSEVRKTDLKTGKVLQSVKMDEKYFGEGITVMNGKIYQLTYQEKTGFVYDLQSMKTLQTFTFDTGEGWGMTNDGTYIIYSDGTSNLYFLDPASLKEVKRIKVTDNYGPVSNINELEFIKGSIYANQWQTDNILKIDPATGKVMGRVDLLSLRERTGIPPVSAQEGAPEVLNGIAYDAATNRIFITGKYWPKLFEVKFDN